MIQENFIKSYYPIPGYGLVSQCPCQAIMIDWVHFNVFHLSARIDGKKHPFMETFTL